MRRPHLLRLPVHPASPPVEHLHPVRPHVPIPRLRVLRNHQRQRDITPRVLRPALQNRKTHHVHLVPLQHHLLARRTPHDLRTDRSHLHKLTQRPHFLHHTLRRPLNQPQQTPHPVPQLFQTLRPQRPRHPTLRPVHVDEHRHVVPFHVLEKQRRPPALRHPVANLRNLQVPRHRRTDPTQFPPALQKLNKVPQILILQSAVLRENGAYRRPKCRPNTP